MMDHDALRRSADATAGVSQATRRHPHSVVMKELDFILIARTSHHETAEVSLRIEILARSDGERLWAASTIMAA